VSASEAKAAIVLAACDASAARDEKLASDAHVIKTVLALVANLDAKRDLSIVAEVFEPRNRTVVEDVARGRAVAVDTEEILAKIIVQTSRTSGLAVVYSELLSFDGCEIYFHSAPFGGVRFDELQFRFADGVPIGIRRSDGALLVRPPPHTVVATGDEVIIVAQDDSSIRFKPQLVVTPENRPPSGARGVRRQERMLVIGWSAKAPIVVREFAQYVLPGSWVDVFVAEPDEALEHDVATLDAELPTLTVRVVRGNPLSRDELAAVDPFGYANVLILRQPARGEVTPERIDAESIVVLLHLRRLWAERGVAGISPTKIITEVHDSSNQELINRAGVNDFIISERLVSMIFAQLSEEPRMKLVYDDLFQESGSEIYVKPASLYFDDFPVRLRFADAMRTAQLRNGEVCIGYKLKALEADASKNFGVSLVPPKDTVLTLGPEDALVVVAEDEG
jgi:K+/H+ antiporter YhaU regulatory subunit KhtT